MFCFFIPKRKRELERKKEESRSKRFLFPKHSNCFTKFLFDYSSSVKVINYLIKKQKKKNKANFWFCLFCWNVNFVNKVELVLSLFMVNHFQGYPRSNGYSSLFLFWFKRSKVLKLIFVEMRQKFEIKL